MAFFSEQDVIDLLDQQTVRLTLMLEMNFLSGVKRVCDDAIDLTTGDGKTWNSLGEFVAVSGIEDAANLEAGVVVYTLSLVSEEIAALAMTENKAEYVGRTATLYGQFYGPDWAQMGNPFAIHTGIMDIITLDWGSDGQEALRLNVEGLFSRRVKPKYSLLTDRDQQGRYSNDTALQFIPQMLHKKVPWPTF